MIWPTVRCNRTRTGSSGPDTGRLPLVLGNSSTTVPTVLVTRRRRRWTFELPSTKRLPRRPTRRLRTRPAEQKKRKDLLDDLCIYLIISTILSIVESSFKNIIKQLSNTGDLLVFFLCEGEDKLYLPVQHARSLFYGI